MNDQSRASASSSSPTGIAADARLRADPDVIRVPRLDSERFFGLTYSAEVGHVAMDR